MSSMGGRVTFFLGLHVKQKEDGIFISQGKYVGEILKKFGFSSIRTTSSPMETNKALTKDEDGEDVDVHLYRSMIGSLMYLTSSRPDIIFSVCACDYTGTSLGRKSTTGGCQFLGSRLIFWQCKKQTVVANSTTEAKYIAASHCSALVKGRISTARIGKSIWLDLVRSQTIGSLDLNGLQLNTATSKTINSVKQIHAIVDGKAVVISESSVRSDLLFNDEDGIACLTNDEIFENLALIRQSTKFSGKVTPLFESMLVQNQEPKGKGSVPPPKPYLTPSTSQPSVLEPQNEPLQIETPPAVSHEPQIEANIEQILPSPSSYQRKQRKTQKHRRAKKVIVLPQTSGSPRCQDTIGGAPAQTRSERVLTQPNEPPLSEGHTYGSGEGRMEHSFELMDIVLDLEKEKDAQAVEILKLKKRVKKLERKRKSSISHSRRRLYRQVESSNDSLDEGGASKQGRISDKTKPMFKESDFDDIDDLVDEGMAFVQEKDAETQEKIGIDVSVAEPPTISTVRLEVSVATPSTPPTTTVFDDDEDFTIAQTLVKIRSEKAKEKGVAFRDMEEASRPVRLITTLQPLPTIDPKDKGKSVLVKEEPKKVKRKDQGLAQIKSDAELAQRLHEEKLAELEKVQRERAAQEDASMAALYEKYDTIQANIDVDALFAAKLQQEYKEQYIIEERAKFLVETIVAQRKFRVAQRDAEIRSNNLLKHS
ncbi:hypothetical protein Tco_1250368 [Tanacetum coccineum]